MKIKLTVLTLLVVGLIVGMSGSALADITLGASTPVGAAVDIPNASSEFAILAFSATGDAADDAISVFDFAEGAVASLSGALTAADVISDMNVYVDSAPVGSLGAEDVLVAGAYTAATLTYTPTAAHAIGVGTVNFIVGATLTGAAPTDDDIAIDTANGNFVNSGAGGIVAADEAGEAMTLVALEYEALSQDFTGPPYSRPNGYLDAVVLNFTVDGVAAAINDATVDDADFTVGGSAVTFTAAAHGDAANDTKIYLDFAEGANTTVSTPALVYAAGTRILSADTEYGLADDAGTAVTDGAPPAPVSVTTIDSNEDGKINQVQIQFSETLTNGTDKNGISFPGLTIASAAAGAGTFAGNSLLTLTITQGSSYNTGIKPEYTYDTSLNTIKDGADNEVASFNYLNVPVTDGALPTLVAAKTLDNDDDGKFDVLQLDFSENIELSAGTADDLDNNAGGGNGFNFDTGSVYDTAYNFAATGHTISGSRINMMVIEIGSFDTAVQPVIEYNGGTLLIDANGNALGAVAAFTNVTSAAGVVSAATIWMQDGMSARVTNGTWLDGSTKTGTTQNGKLDTISLTFSEPMGTTTTTYTNLTIAGHSAISAVVEGPTVYVKVNETGYDTGDTPDVTYSGTAIVDANNAKLMSLDSSDITELDGAYPIIYEAATLDEGYGAGASTGVHNGQIDAIRLSFSEDMNVAARDADLPTEFGVQGYAVVDTVIIAAANQFILQLTQSGSSDTDATPDVVYTDDGANPLMDMNDLVFQDLALTDLTSVDRAPAAIITATTQDANVDGYLDGVLLAFSEDVTIASLDDVRTGVTLTTVSNAIDLTSATATSPAADQVKIIGTSAMGSDKWDTSALPKVAFAATNGIKDAVANEVAAVSNVSTVDGAAPVIGKAVGQVASTNITVTFSEAVTNDAAAALDAGDFDYYSTLNGYSIANVTNNGDTNAATWLVQTDSTLTLEYVTNDKLVVLANSIEDVSPATNVAPVDTVSISDAVAPTLTSKQAYDLNYDGFIDTIKLVFSEDINEQNILGWSADFDTMCAHGADLNTVFKVQRRGGSFWSPIYYDEYKIIGLNLTEDAGDATAAQNELRAHDIVKSWDPICPNVSDVKGDNTIYLYVIRPRELRTADYENAAYLYGDSEDRPYVSMTGGSSAAGGAGVGDFSPNYSADFSAQRCDDKSPAILKAAFMVQEEQGYIMKFYVSEPFKSLTAASTTFTWKVGTENIDYAAAGYIVNFRQDPDTTWAYTLESNMPVLHSTASTLDYAGASKIQDANSNWNSTNGDVVDVTMWEPVTPGVEGEDATDVPEVYALSKNFPNPFNPSTTINYDIAGTGGQVSMVIYNMTGQKVRTLVDDVKEPGFYSVVWDGTDDLGMSVSSGIYLYRIVSGDFSAYEKMTFVK